jgi:hypothetical protein
MKHAERWTAVVIVAGGLPLLACGRKADTHAKEHPAEVERIEGTEVSRVTLTARAMERLDLKTDQVREQKVARSASAQRVVPYSSLIYDPQGRTWVYTSPQAGTFQRHRVEVDYIEGDVVVLKDGPPAGTVVASVGVAELYGTEMKVGH